MNISYLYGYMYLAGITELGQWYETEMLILLLCNKDILPNFESQSSYNNILTNYQKILPKTLMIVL